MRDSRAHLPIRYQMMNIIGRLLVATGWENTRLDEQVVYEAAKQQAELTDFGDPYFRQGLQVLLESAEKDANLHPIGRLVVNDMITNFLVQRLRLEEARIQDAEIFEKPLIPPLIICGPARSGTTFLHNLLALDPAHRGLPQWLLMRPFPEGPDNADGLDPRFVKAEQGLRMRLPMLEGVDSIHYSRADSPEECIVVLGMTFHSLIFFTLFPVYSYMEWYLDQEDFCQKYREYRWLLQVFQAQEPNLRLTLKAPAHTGCVGTILEEVPQAMMVMTHRDPVACISSACSLLYTYHLGVANQIEVQRMAQLLLRTYETLGKRHLEFRESNPGVMYDVYYDSLVSDPIETVRGIYSHFGLQWTEEYSSTLADYIQRNKKGKHGKHRYTSSDFGLAEGEIKERMKFYIDYFGM